MSSIKMVIKLQYNTIRNNFIKSIKHISKGIYNYIFNKNKDISAKRTKICDNCKEIIIYGKDEKICGQCGCFIKLKTKVLEEKCPLNKW